MGSLKSKIQRIFEKHYDKNDYRPSAPEPTNTLNKPLFSDTRQMKFKRPASRNLLEARHGTLPPMTPVFTGTEEQKSKNSRRGSFSRSKFLGLMPTYLFYIGKKRKKKSTKIKIFPKKNVLKRNIDAKSLANANFSDALKSRAATPHNVSVYVTP